MQENENTVATLNKAMNSYNLLQLRLDTSDLLNQAKMFMNAELEIVSQDSESGDYKRDIISIGDPKANRAGVASILNWLQMIINPQVVQGNFPVDRSGHSEMYDAFIYECQMDLLELLMINIYTYEIEDEEVSGIIDGMMKLIIPFMTRPIGNKERESYGETFKEINNTSMSDTRKMPIFKQ